MTLDKIKTVLCEADMEGLIRMGAPDDEYDCEAVAIFERLDSAMKPHDLAQVIADVFNDFFHHDELGLPLNPPHFVASNHFKNMARKILGSKLP